MCWLFSTVFANPGWVNCEIFLKFSFAHCLLPTRTKQFRQNSRKTYAQNMEKKSKSLEKIRSICASGHLKCNFDNTGCVSTGEKIIFKTGVRYTNFWPFFVLLSVFCQYVGYSRTKKKYFQSCFCWIAFSFDLSMASRLNVRTFLDVTYQLSLKLYGTFVSLASQSTNSYFRRNSQMKSSLSLFPSES